MTTTKPPIYKRRSVHISVAVLSLLFVITLIAFPYGIGYGMKQWILDNGDDRVSVENVDFNPFTGTLVIHKLQAERANTRPLIVEEVQLQFVWHKLLSKQVVLEGVRVRGVDLDIEQTESGQFRVGGITSQSDNSAPDTASPEVPWEVAIQSIELEDIDLNYISPKISSHLRINTLQLNNLASFTPDQVARLTLNGQVDGAGIQFDGGLKPFAAVMSIEGKLKIDRVQLNQYQVLLPKTIQQLQGAINLNTKVSMQYQADGSYDAKMDGDVSLDGLSLNVNSSQISGKFVSWSGQSHISSKGGHQGSKIALTGDTRLNDIHISTQDDIVIDQERLAWAGKVDIVLPAEGEMQINAEGQADSTLLVVQANAHNAHLQYAQLEWKGDLALSSAPASDLLSLDSSGELTIESFKAVSPGENYTLMTFDHFKMTEIHIQAPEYYKAKQAAFESLTLGQQKADKGVAYYGQLSLEAPRYSVTEGLSIESIQLVDARQTVQRSNDGKWNAIRLVNIMKTAAKKKTTSESEENTVPDSTTQENDTQIYVGNIVVSGDSRIIFDDKQVMPAFREELRIQKGVLSLLDTRKPTQKSPLELKGVIGKRSEFSITGAVSPFSPKLSIDLKVQLEGLPLPPLSSYTTTMLGHTLDSGEIDINMDLKSKDGQLDVKNELNLHQVDVSPISPEEMEKLDPKPDVPLETGLSMLKDKNNNIKIDLPITGDVDNLKVDPADVINQALGKAMKHAAKTFIAVALFPYGTLLTIVEIAGDKAMQINLDPIEYEPGTSNLTNKHKEYLEKVSKILEERPEMHVKLCGVATASDRSFLLQQANLDKDGKPLPKDKLKTFIPDDLIMTLAARRAEVIESLFVELHKVKGNRLISCKARIEKEDDKSKPRTELSL